MPQAPAAQVLSQGRQTQRRLADPKLSRHGVGKATRGGVVSPAKHFHLFGLETISCNWPDEVFRHSCRKSPSSQCPMISTRVTCSGKGSSIDRKSTRLNSSHLVIS